ncbi:fumarylacetoacetate hydrolase family protein [Ramlibacter rhizophilus]|uniref:2-hydroxyhepta-2,4-diene-1,7-dioate isomerase n=1 Tax=Ramlibacter rhizophilus TaxID=1781167 RepID=A0A4Z0BKP4_9BURK|nr:fumarylacetoacetate hydrolase family protein [Ramlibacter rhizophilus]TFY99886.1 2-hydroxyhepta-2,4-diene-1,7-dioate isomerase [Ramlibacter rhizophilus]
MRQGRVVHGGAVHGCTPWPAQDGASEERVRLADGRVLGAHEVQWLAPFEPRTIFTLALNYADHASELAAKSSADQASFLTAQKAEPIVFLKAANAIVGHRGFTRRPQDADFMHYECELAVVIGREGRRIPREQALDHVLGYTVANDYAIRNFLEPYYRPNLRVKNRDAATALGPWLVPKALVPDPMALRLTTHVDGQLVQEGTTADMIHDIPSLIAYLSDIMTLSPGDVILTGTPKGSVDVRPGQEVVCEVESVGRLVNTLVEDWEPADLRG